ncbi:MAG: sigma factor-like helix-turn-helix DNA-binding protein [Nanoarchaeota archaeon]|nr:sigma factor-like helix-turn-helix DNA-binding protein [Nanoarchaeota archaeon]
MNIDLGKKEVEVLFGEFIEFLKQKNIKLEKIDKYSIPVSIFTKKLSASESIIKFLREEYKLDYKKIGELLRKKAGPVGVTYRNAKKKFSGKLEVISEHYIPITVFDSKQTLFESVVKHMHDELDFSFKEIASELGRNYRTVWTIYKRAKNRKVKNKK